jgi:hypothetical protein
MSSTRNRRSLVTALVVPWFGVFAVADAIGQGWGAAVPLAVAAVPMAFVYYVWGGRDSDFAAVLIAPPPDEREALIRTRARALAGNAMYAALPVSSGCGSTVTATKTRTLNSASAVSRLPDRGRTLTVVILLSSRSSYS